MLPSSESSKCLPHSGQAPFTVKTLVASLQCGHLILIFADILISPLLWICIYFTIKSTVIQYYFWFITVKVSIWLVLALKIKSSMLKIGVLVVIPAKTF